MPIYVEANSSDTETRLARDWGSEGPPLVWEMPVGTGYSAPAVVGERLVYFHRVADEEVVECFHPERGLVYWTFAYASDYLLLDMV